MTASLDLSFIERHPLIGAALWATLPSAVALVAAPALPVEELRKVVYAGAATLFFGGLLGGVLKLILDEVAETKRRREDAATFVTNVLSDLKSVYDEAATAQLLIAAQRSAKTYGDELRGLFKTSVRLRNIQRALAGRADGVDERCRTAVSEEVARMRTYLDDLTLEFRREYKHLSDQQRFYEARAEAIVKEFALANERASPPALPSFVWDSISELPNLKDFIENGSKYSNGFESPIDNASSLLRSELASVLRRSRMRYRQ